MPYKDKEERKAYQRLWSKFWRKNNNQEKKNQADQLWRENNPEKIDQYAKESRKDGKYYAKRLMYEKTGLQKEKRKIRHNHSRKWQKYKGNWLTETEIHHEWIHETADYNGIAIVDKSEHRHNIINPIEILEGNITLMGVI